MKLAEALMSRADLNRRYAQLRERLHTVARIQEGESPAEKPGPLLAELDRVLDKLETLIRQINLTNSVSVLGDGLTLTAALAKRDVLSQRRNAYASLAKAASVRQDRYSRSEVKFVATVAVSDLRKRADQLSRDYRILDAQIQEANWKLELREQEG